LTTGYKAELLGRWKIKKKTDKKADGAKVKK
jgi:hypothetical protein